MHSRFTPSFSRLRQTLYGLLIAGIMVSCQGLQEDEGFLPAPLTFAGKGQLNAGILGPQFTRSSEWNFGEADEIRQITFDKRKYPEAKAIVLRAELSSGKSDVSSHVRLYNLTDEKPILSSELSDPYRIVTSTDLSGELPEKEITLVLQMRSGQEGIHAGARERTMLLVVQE